MMTDKQGSADLLLKLYELRREPTLRAARAWFMDRFHPKSAQDVFDMYMSKESAPYRMASTYWNMACAFVVHGVIDPAMFADVNSEHFPIYATVEPYLAEVRTMIGNPAYLKHLEDVVRTTPGSADRLARFHRYLKHKESQYAPARRAKAKKRR
jgi:hypothetical protein